MVDLGWDRPNAKPNMDRWFHYTLGTRLVEIIAARHISRASGGVPKGERRAVWFTRREIWEPTATKLIIDDRGIPRRMTIEAMVARGGALVRLEVPESVARHTWAKHRQIGRIDPRHADGLEQAALEDGSDPADWRVAYNDVPVASILSIDASNDGEIWTRVGAGADAAGAFSLDASFTRTVRRALQHRHAKTEGTPLTYRISKRPA
jgi:hypothetical protein